MMAVLIFVLTGLACWCWWGPGSVADGVSFRPDVLHAKEHADFEHHRLAQLEAGEFREGVTSVPLLLDLLGTSLDAGLTVQGALRVVATIADEQIQGRLLCVVAGLEIGASWDNSWEGNVEHAGVARIHEALSFGALTGASAAPLLYAEARQNRNAAGRAAEKRAATLGVKLVLPLGLCSLPAFIALGIVPVVMAMVPEF